MSEKDWGVALRKGAKWGFAGLVLMVLLSPLLTYYFVSFEDVSQDPRYSALIGRTFRSIDETLIHGISMERDYKPILDHYDVTGIPGIGGREVLSQERLAIGTEMRVRQVMRCVDCFLDFGGRVHLVVELVSLRHYDQARIEVPIELVVGGQRKFVDAGP